MIEDLKYFLGHIEAIEVRGSIWIIEIIDYLGSGLKLSWPKFSTQYYFFFRRISRWCQFLLNLFFFFLKLILKYNLSIWASTPAPYCSQNLLLLSYFNHLNRFGYFWMNPISYKYQKPLIWPISSILWGHTCSHETCQALSSNIKVSEGLLSWIKQWHANKRSPFQ